MLDLSNSEIIWYVKPVSTCSVLITDSQCFGSEVELNSKVFKHPTSLINILYATSVILELLQLSVALHRALVFVAFILKSSQNRIFQQMFECCLSGGSVQKILEVMTY